MISRLNAILARCNVRSWVIPGAPRAAPPPMRITPMQTLALIALMVALWSLTHIYKGLSGDAELYALQALSRLRPGLATDLYLQNVSQDRFTIFSPLYAWFIGRLGLQEAGLALTLASTLWFLTAAWILARRLAGPTAAFLAVTALLIIKGIYGSYEVFSYMENWLTARSVAEAMVVTALACHVCGRRRLALFVAAAALAIHPIMALPGLLLLLCLRVSWRLAALAAVAGVMSVLALAGIATTHPQAAGLLSVMDPTWLEVVTERSQFLFLQHWTLDDWELNSRPFLYLGAYACILEGRTRQLCLASMIVGAAGLAVAAVAGLVGPVPLLLQGQAWRWVWIPSFMAVLLLPVALGTVWNDRRCGRLCALLLLLGWTFPLMDRDVCAGLAWMLWLTRARLSENAVQYLAWAAVALTAVVVGWILANTWTTVSSPSPETGRDPLFVSHLRNILLLGPSAIPLLALLFIVIRRTRPRWLLASIAAVLAAGTVSALPGTLKYYRQGAEFAQFADWRDAIAPADVVFIVPAHNSAGFAWFTLERPSYLAVDQSAGVVFSRATALEVKRRSEVLLPLEDPDWRLLTAIRLAHSGATKKPVKAGAALTPGSLVGICRDPILAFVVAKEDVGFDPMRHRGAGVWKDWNLYDCRTVRAKGRAE